MDIASFVFNINSLLPYKWVVYREGEDPRRRSNFSFCDMLKFQSVWLTAEKEFKSKDNPLNDRPPFCLSLVLGSSKRGQFTWC